MTYRIKRLIKLLVLGFMLTFAFQTLAQQKEPNISIDDLLEKVKQGHRRDQQINQQRLEDFQNNRQEQQNLLSGGKRNRVDAEALSLSRETQFEKNEQQISLLEERLTERLGSLKELFGVLQLVANDAQGQFDNSLIQIHYPERSEKLNEFSRKMGQTTELPSVEEIESLWFELQREITESGKIVQSRHIVLLQNGQEVETDLLRVGTFNLISDQKYIQRIAETGRIVEYPRQPSSRYMSGAKSIENGTGELVPFTIDPIRGQLISLLGAAPNLTERVQQGGIIGYVIVSLGVIVVLLALGRFAFLAFEDRKISKQLKHLDQPMDNALGRVIKVYQDHKSEHLESLELKLGEAVLRELPRINRGLSFIKISAAVAPLLGLLGTVTGMIITFQAITLFGAGDPKLMAGGISQALVTTVLGLIVAIPTLLLHNIVSSRATKITQIIEQEAVALIALQAENNQE
jgi:biopolymer transport protein ExbB